MSATNNTDDRISFRSLSHALMEYATSGEAQDLAFAPKPLEPDRRKLLEAVANFISMSDECGSLSGLVSVLEAAAASEEVTLRDVGSAMWVIRQHLELLSDAALVESNARYRLHLADLHEAREAGRKEGRARRKRPEGSDG